MLEIINIQQRVAKLGYHVGFVRLFISILGG